MKSILIYSGGLDSTVLLYDLLKQGHEVHCLSVDYGQRHRREIESAKAITAWLGVDHQVADLRSITGLLAGSSQTSPDVQVPEGHYAAESMKLTVVPNRNMILLSVAVGWAISLKAHQVVYAAHGGDHAIYPDCRPDFVDALKHAVTLADWHQVNLRGPYTAIDKSDIVKIGDRLRVPFEKTWSCYNGGDLHCGRCSTCVERREAFEKAAVADPTEYGDRDFWRTVTGG
jgi:7-cyano-7-deazaguanine synthase